MGPSLTEQMVQEGDAAVATVEAYLTWLEERDAVKDAYERWAGGSPWGAALAFGAFQDALDREERASNVYETVVRRFATDACAPAPVSRLQISVHTDQRYDERADAA